jgi:hypothetical protein
MNVKWEALEGKEEDKQIDAILQLHQHIILSQLLRLHFRQKDLVPYGIWDSGIRLKQPQWRQLLLPLS